MNSPAVGRPAWPARPGLLVVIDRRRPASWLALAAAAGTVLAVSIAPVRAAESVAFVAGGLAAVAACGCPARGLGARLVTLWLLVRIAWPLAGVAAACGCLLLLRGNGVGMTAVAVAGGIAAAGATILAATRRGAPAADAASLALTLVCGAALVAGGVTTLIAPGLIDPGMAARDAAGSRMLVAIGSLWLSLAGLAGIVAASLDLEATAFAAPPAGAMAAGRVRLVLLWLAMVTTLAGMVTCFFLAPDQAGWYPVLVLAWFASLALPQATLLMGDEHAAAWQRLLRSIRGPAFAAIGCRTAATIGSLLGWPAAVALVVRTAVPSGDAKGVVSAAVASVVGLAIATAVVSCAGLVTTRARPSRETALACGCAFFIAAAVVAASLPGLPGLPGSGP